MYINYYVRTHTKPTHIQFSSNKIALLELQIRPPIDNQQILFVITLKTLSFQYLIDHKTIQIMHHNQINNYLLVSNLHAQKATSKTRYKSCFSYNQGSHTME